MKKDTLARQLGILLVVAASLVAYGIVAHAQDATVTETTAGTSRGAALHGVTFPIPELGNCASEGGCRTYCNDTGHLDACVSFAKAHGLMNQDEAERAEKFKHALQSGGGPGGCSSPAACQAFCSDPANLESCITFAKKQGIHDRNVSQGEKILAYLKAGGRMPGNCASRESCEEYCKDFSHAEECYAFAQNAGIGQASGRSAAGGDEDHRAGGLTAAQARTLSQLAESGQTPGRCDSQDSCGAYCQDSAHRDECVAFGVKIGLIGPEEADQFRKIGGNGPGGCHSPDSCRAYCNDPSHQQECFKFAKDHGFITQDEATQTQEGLGRLRMGLEQAPPEVAACLKSTIGPDVIDDIESGKFVPGPDIGQAMSSCFQKFGSNGKPAEIFKNASPEVINCLKDKIGDQFNDISSGNIMPTPEMIGTFRACFQEMQIQGEPQGETQERPFQDQQGVSTSPPSLPPELLACIKQIAGDAAVVRLQSGQKPGVDIISAIQQCYGKLKQGSAPTSTSPSPSPPASFNEQTNLLGSIVQSFGGFLKLLFPN